MHKTEVKIINKLGLHARAATKFVQLCAKHDSKITVKDGIRSVNGKSIIGLMTLAARQGTVLSIQADGVDERELLHSLQELITGKFGEPA